MKRKITALMCLGMATFVSAQTSVVTEAATPRIESSANGFFNHLDASVTIGTTGFGFDIATPVSDWVRLRAGGSFRLLKNFSASLESEVGTGLTQEIQTERFDKLSNMMQSFLGIKPSRSIELEGDFKLNSFKFLVDVFPFKNNRHWRATVGFYYGNGTIVDGRNTSFSVNTLAAVSSYNLMYDKALVGEFLDMSSLGIEFSEEVKTKVINKLRSWGEYTDASGNVAQAEYGISFPMGTYAHDVVAQQDIYDANGRLVHRKGEVVRKSGETLRMLPDDDDMIRYDVHVNRFKPYVGVGYELAVSKDKRSMIGVDAGVLFWGGKPRVDIKLPVGKDAEGNTLYQSLDLVTDVNDIPGKLGDHIDKASDYSVFPELSVRFTRRLW